MENVAKSEVEQNLPIEVTSGDFTFNTLDEFVPSFLGNQMTEKQENALNLHAQIKQDMNNVALHLVLMSKNLKRMRDEELYKEFDFAEFGEYTETALQIKQRQAYNYIQAYERLGEQFLQSNANYGISKLQLLSTLSTAQREEVIQNNDINALTVAELKKKLVEKDQQISMFEEEKKNNKKLSAMDEEQVKEFLNNKKRFEEEKAAFEVQKQQGIKQAVDNALKAEKAEIEKNIKKTEREARDKAIKEKTLELEKKSKSDKEKLEAELKKKQEELSEKDRLIQLANAKLSQEQQERSSLEKRAAASLNPDYEHFKFEFEKMQEFAANAKVYYYKLPRETQEKLKAPIQMFISSFFDEDPSSQETKAPEEANNTPAVKTEETATKEAADENMAVADESNKTVKTAKKHKNKEAA